MFSPILFADDTTLSAISLNYNSLIALVNRELVGISGWMATNRLSLNVGKTVMMLISNRQHDGHFDDGGVLLNGEEISFCESGNFLGVCLDRGLKFDDHVRTVWEGV